MAKQKMFYGANNLIFENAKALRNRMTNAEMLLWGELKGNQLGVRFRRQHPIKNYITDFYCHHFNLVIEVDGSIHRRSDILLNDIQRDEHLKSLGITTLRFTNEEIFQNLNSVVSKINNFLNPQPPSGGERWHCARPGGGSL